MGEAAAHERVPCDVSELIVGTECGGSDGFSGITANPALGHAVATTNGYNLALLLGES